MSKPELSPKAGEVYWTKGGDLVELGEKLLGNNGFYYNVYGRLNRENGDTSDDLDVLVDALE